MEYCVLKYEYSMYSRLRWASGRRSKFYFFKTIRTVNYIVQCPEAAIRLNATLHIIVVVTILCYVRVLRSVSSTTSRSPRTRFFFPPSPPPCFAITRVKSIIMILRRFANQNRNRDKFIAMCCCTEYASVRQPSFPSPHLLFFILSIIRPRVCLNLT